MPGRRLVAFLGGTIGNFEPVRRTHFLAQLRACLGPHDRLLLGTDLVKSADVLVPAYDDPATAAWARLRHWALPACGDLGRRAGVDRMRMRSVGRQRVPVADLDLCVDFDDGEEFAHGHLGQVPSGPAGR